MWRAFGLDGPWAIEVSERPSAVADVVVVGLSSDSASWGGVAAGSAPWSGEEAARALEFARANGFTGAGGEVQLVPVSGSGSPIAVAFAGLGAPAEVSPDVLRRSYATAGRAVQRFQAVGLQLPPGEALGRAAATGLLLGLYDPRGQAQTAQVVFGGADAGLLEAVRRHAAATVLARDLTNAPPNYLRPADLAAIALRLADQAGLQSEVWELAELAERGFGGIVAVSQGSDHPARVIKLHYVPERPRRRVALIGKGVCFDSGGLNIKVDADDQWEMKTDMAGGAAVLAAMTALSALGARDEVIGFIPAAENMPGPNAYMPGSVITHYGGRTSEISDTDSEGRLLIADLLAYAREVGCDAIVDMGTLVGPIMGPLLTPVMSTSDDLVDELLAASASSGERVMRVPLYDDPYLDGVHSDYADVKNSGWRSGAGALITSSLFLRNFVGRDAPWAHFDIAGSARAPFDCDEASKGATGAMVRLLLDWLAPQAH